jgi:hypothetical protein
VQWQDIAITIGTVVFIVALIPSILGKDKPAVPTSMMTGTVLVVFTIVYISLALWFAAVTTGITAILWYILAIQVILRRRRK